MTTIRTISGKMIDLLNPKPADINIEDIAHHLAYVNRFAGATDQPVSVAAHSLNVQALVMAMGGTPEEQLAALLHDAHEAYMVDIPTPVIEAIGHLSGMKMNPVKQLKNALDYAISKSLWPRGSTYIYGLSLIKAADKLIMDREVELYGSREGDKIFYPLVSVRLDDWMDSSYPHEVAETFVNEYGRLYAEVSVRSVPVEEIMADVKEEAKKEEEKV